MQRKIIVSIILIGSFLTLGAGLATLLVVTKPQPHKVEQNHAPLLVSAVTVNPQTIIEPIVGYATARADRYARLSAQVAGEIVEIVNNLKIGDKVKKGQPLIHIDTKEYEHILARAKSTLEAIKAQKAQLDVEEQNLNRLISIAKNEMAIAEREYERVKNLHSRDMAPRREYDLAHLAFERTRRELQSLENSKALLPEKRAQLAANIINSQAEVKLAQLNLNRCTIAAPFNGKVNNLHVEVGEHVSMGRELLTILDPGIIEVPIELPASVRPRVKVGTKCMLTVDSIEGATWTGYVKRIGPSASESTRTFELFVEVDNTKQTHELIPGYFVRATIEGPTLENVMIVPRGSIQQNHVFVHQEGKAYSRNIIVKRNLRERSIVAGLDQGSVIITSNLDALYEGAPVRLGGSTGKLEGKTAINSERDSITEMK
ncbi:MAG: efflux RND transporter periplasmic adaptor subunit [Planctomycetota bacterium]|nr:MAG: efflux RND transporter periplasmic adaptor subunit [Planctomycetota bacterium]